MSSRKRIQRKNPWQPTPAPDILQTRGFSNGKKARDSRLPQTDILQTRPFAKRDDVSTPKDTRSFEEKMQGAEFRYNGVSIPTVQREEVAEENSQEQAEGETNAGNISVFAPSAPPENPILSPFSLFKADGLGQQETVQREEVSVGEEEKEGFEVGIQKQQLQAPPDDGTIQRLCAECEGELAEKEDKEPIQAKLTVGEAGDKYEQEADAVASQVVEKINGLQTQQPVQRQSELGEASVPNITVMRHGEGGVGDGDVTEVGKKDTSQEQEVDSISQVITENEQSGYTSASEAEVYPESEVKPLRTKEQKQPTQTEPVPQEEVQKTAESHQVVNLLSAVSNPQYVQAQTIAMQPSCRETGRYPGNQ